MKIPKISRRRLCSSKHAELSHAERTTKKCTDIYYGRAKPLFFSLIPFVRLHSRYHCRGVLLKLFINVNVHQETCTVVGFLDHLRFCKFNPDLIGQLNIHSCFKETCILAVISLTII